MQTEPSFHHFHVQHFCPVAQALERIGDRWSFLIVRDLMRGPQRFTDLQRYLAGITPKRLTVNLRALESEGIVEREREPGRREVWYRLTEKGRGLVPVIEALRRWSIEYNLRMPQPVTWTLDFGPTSVFTIRFDGDQWSTQPKDAPDADVRIETTPQAWAAFV